MSTLSQFFGSPPINIATQTPDGRISIEGGWYISRGGGGFGWIVAPNSAQVSRTWYCRDDATTTANACTGCTGWFVPTSAQLRNPGYTCRKYWDSFSSAYWTSTEYSQGAGTLSFLTGLTCTRNRAYTYFVRAFRCVTY
jgi:hypothetical protein